MYFQSRAVAGCVLAQQLMPKYRYDNTAVLALSLGGVAVGYQIAAVLHASLHQLAMGTVRIDDESVDYCTVLPGGGVAMNPHLSLGAQEYYAQEYAGLIDIQLRREVSKINQLSGASDITPEIFRDYNVIVVDDGVQTDTAIDAVRVWLKPARIKRLVLATPMIDTDALDTAHVIFDELHILNAYSRLLDTAHYFTQNDLPSESQAQLMTEQVVLHWK